MVQIYIIVAYAFGFRNHWHCAGWKVIWNSKINVVEVDMDFDMPIGAKTDVAREQNTTNYLRSL